MREITSKHVGDFYCLHFLHSFRTKTKRESHQKVCANKDFCGVLMLSEDTHIPEFNQYRKHDETPSFIYADLEYLINKIDRCKNNSEKLSTANLVEHFPCRYSMYMIWTFDGIEYKHGVYQGEHCIKKFCESLREYTMNIINFEKKIK